MLRRYLVDRETDQCVKLMIENRDHTNSEIDRSAVKDTEGKYYQEENTKLMTIQTDKKRMESVQIEEKK